MYIGLFLPIRSSRTVTHSRFTKPDAAPEEAVLSKQPIHKTGRGAGGGCFIKDIAALKLHVKKHLPEDTLAHAVLEAAEQKNIELLKSTDKDLDLLEGVYGAKIARKTAGKRGSKKRR